MAERSPLYQLSDRLDELETHVDELAGLYELFREGFLENESGTVWECSFPQMQTMEGLFLRILYDVRGEVSSIAAQADAAWKACKEAREQTPQE